MQEDEFEKKLQNKLQELRFVPDDEVWQKVSARISKQKKRRTIFVFWISLGFLLIAGTSALLVFNNFNNKETFQNTANHNEIKTINRAGKPTNIDRLTINSTINKNLVATKEKLVAFNYNKESNQKKESNHQKESIYNKSFVKETDNPTEKIHSKEIATINKITGKNEKTDIAKNTNTQTEIPFFPHKFYNPNLMAKTVVEPNTSLKGGELNFKNDTADKTSTKEIVQSKEAEKKWTFGVTIYSGFANNLSGMGKISATPAVNNSTGSGGLNNNVSDSSGKFKIGFSFGLGLFVKKQLTERLSLSAGIDYHSYSVQLKVGNKINVSGSVLDPLSYPLANASSYYARGSSVDYRNKYRLTELPVNVGYRINKNQQKPILISAGISPGYLVSTNALFGNATTGLYYEDKDKLHHFQFSSQAGLLFPVSAAKKYLLSAGPSIQYGLSNAAKAASGSAQHLFFAGIKATITLK